MVIKSLTLLLRPKDGEWIEKPLGLDLTIVQRIIKGLGKEVGAESKLGKRTMITYAPPCTSSTKSHTDSTFGK